MKRIINSGNAPKAVGPYSQAVKKDNMLFISGQIPVNPLTGLIDEGITEQTVQVMQNLSAILKEAGYSFDNVVKCTCLLTDMKHFPAMNEVYGSFFGSNPPARVTYAVSSLPLGVMVEIDAIAIK